MPGRAALQLEHLVLDVNGTLALDGALLPSVAERLTELRTQRTLHLLTADTHGRRREIDGQLNLTGVRFAHGTPADEQKAAHVRMLGAERVVAIGNGRNDALMLREAALAIAATPRRGRR